MMRKGAKHRVGGAVREGERQREREREREEETEELQRRREREGGDAHGGKIRGRAGWTEGEKGTEKRERRSYCGWWGFRVHPPSTASWNKQTGVRQTALFLMGREARCALDVSLHLSFSKCCFVCSPLNKAPVPQKGTTLYLLLYIITSHSRRACLLL